MALDVQQLRKDLRFEVEKVEKFESLAREAWDKPWWREFVTLIDEHRQAALMTLAAGMDDQRVEDRLRGQIVAYSFIIVLDQQAKQLINEKENGRAR